MDLGKYQTGLCNNREIPSATLRTAFCNNWYFYYTKNMLQAVDVAVEMNENRDLGIPVLDYVDENISDKVVKIIQSYTGVINKMVWRKY